MHRGYASEKGEKHTLIVVKALHECNKQKTALKPAHKRAPLEGFKVVTKGGFI